MHKKNFLVVLFMLTALSAVFAFDYWYIDAYINGSLQIVYFFMDVKIMDAVFGILPNDHEWRPVSLIPFGAEIVFEALRKNGFQTAVVFYGMNDNIYGGQTGGEYIYHVYLMVNGRAYFDILYLNIPIHLGNR